MNSEELYAHMKRALDFFGLKFSEKVEMTVAFEEDRIIFSHGKETIAIDDTSSQGVEL